MTHNPGVHRAVASVVVDATTLEHVETDVCSAIAALDDFSFAAVVEPRSNGVRAAAGVDREGLEAWLAADDTLLDRVSASGSVVDDARWSVDVDGDASIVGAVTLRREPQLAVLLVGATAADAFGGPAGLADLGDLVAFGVESVEDGGERRAIARELRASKRKIEELHSTVNRILRSESEQEVYELAVDAAENILEFDICGVDVVEDGYFVPQVNSSEMPDDGYDRMSVEDGIAGKTYRNKESYRFDDVREVSEAQPQAEYRAILSVPMGDIGVFQAGSREVGWFDDDDVELAELLLSHVAEAVRRLRSEAALRESEEKYRTLVEQSHEAIYIFRDESLLFVNGRASQLTGYTETELLDRSPWDIVHPDDKEYVREMARRRIRDEDVPDAYEARIRRKSGETRYWEFTATVITYDGAPAILGSARDVTERRENQRELERQNERLEEFASVVSHDLRSPLNVADGMLDLARETGDAEHFEKAQEAIDRMERLIQDVLELARKGRIVDETERVELAPLVLDAWETVTEDTDRLSLAVDGAVVEADSLRLQELFVNLFRNVDEHAGSDVAVEVGLLDDGFYVADDGPGIPADRRESIFDRGYSTAEDGTGFGLAITRNIVKAHGWEVSAAESGSGARDSKSATSRSNAPDDARLT
ncbi:PAS domain S-box protein [Halobacteriaceae archaeon GCM10025711]